LTLWSFIELVLALYFVYLMNTDKPQSSAFARGDGEVHMVPMSVIQRPLPAELNEDKVKAFMEEMKVHIRSWLI